MSFPFGCLEKLTPADTQPGSLTGRSRGGSGERPVPMDNRVIAFAGTDSDQSPQTNLGDERFDDDLSIPLGKPEAMDGHRHAL